MDVNKANAVSPVGQGGTRKERKRGAEDDNQNNQQDSDGDADADSLGSDTEAFAMDGLLAASLSPDAQKAFESLAREIEPLRAEVERARGREAHFRELAEKHSFLPVPGRREFLRELGHVLGHMEHLSPPPSLVLLHLVNGDDIRRRFGRGALDGVLTHVCAAVSPVLHPTDIVGSLGGNDFGIVLLIGDAERADERLDRLLDAVAGQPFSWQGQTVALTVAGGIGALAGIASPEDAVAAADRDLVTRLAAPAAAVDGTPDKG